MQQVWVGVGESARPVELPGPDQHVMPGIRWGSAADPYAPAYWAALCRGPEDVLPHYVSDDATLIEAVGFCLLGGFGIKFEVNQAAYVRLRDAGAFEDHVRLTVERLTELLVAPLLVGGRSVRYRFPNQRARRIAAMREDLVSDDLAGLSPLELRDRLQAIGGIGPKTASWIVRNHLGSDEVAILDVHVIRACRTMSLFPDEIVLPRDYAALERRFLEFADGIGVQASVLDAVMWSEVRQDYGAARR